MKLLEFIRPAAASVITDAETWMWGAKLTGALAGSAISLAYILPRGRRDAALRLIVGAVTGIVFSPAAEPKTIPVIVGAVTGIVFGSAAGLKIGETMNVLDHVSLIELTLMGATFTSLCAWWALGVLHRMAERLPMPGWGDAMARANGPRPSGEQTTHTAGDAR